MSQRRLVRVAPSFSDRLDELLPGGRTAAGQPSATDFLLHELPRIIDRLAQDYESVTLAVPAGAAGTDHGRCTRAHRRRLHGAGGRWCRRDHLPRHRPATQLTTVLAGEAATDARVVRTLVEVAESADLVVVGSHGRTGLSRLVLGSVAMACVQHAACPVVVVRPSPED